MAVAWAWAFDTPFKWTKQVASHFGGTRQGMAISWPGHIKDAGGIRTQFHHVIDIVPTILEATGIPAPTTVDGIAQRPIEGVSMAYTFDKANAKAPSTRNTQYFEMVGNRAHLPRWLDRQHHAARAAVAAGHRQAARRRTTTSGSCTTSPTTISQDNDLAAKNPDKLKEMQALFLTEAAKYQVFPLDNSRSAAAPHAAAERHRRARPSLPTRVRTPASRWATRRAS